MHQNNNDVFLKLQILSNRIRCKNCNAGPDDAVFIISDDLRFKSSFFRPTREEPVFKVGKKLRVNKTQNLEINESLVRICLSCGTSRKTLVPKVFEK